MIEFSGTKIARSVATIGAMLTVSSVLAFAGENVTADTIVRTSKDRPG